MTLKFSLALVWTKFGYFICQVMIGFLLLQNGECNQVKVLFETSSPRLMCENVELV